MRATETHTHTHTHTQRTTTVTLAAHARRGLKIYSLTTALYYDCFVLVDKVRAIISSTSCLLCNNIVLFFESSSSTLWETVSLLTFLPLTVCYSEHTYPLTVCYSVHTYPLIHTCKQISSDYQSLMVYGYRGSNLTCAIYKKLPNSTRNDQTSQNIYTFVSQHEKTPGHDSKIFVLIKVKFSVL